MPPKPENTTGDRDYGKRLYVSKKPYQLQMRMRTDAHYGRGARVPHSESKKPYLPDQDYPEMEHFRFDWDNPNWPPNDPPGFPDDPVITDDPEVNGYTGEDKPKDRDNRFLGCEFAQPFNPGLVLYGETTFAKLARRDDPVTYFTVHGPAKIIGRQNQALCTAAGQAVQDVPWANSPECTVIARADDGPGQFEPDSSGGIRVVVVAHTVSGSSCSAEFIIKVCPIEPGMEWDSEISADSMARNDTKTVAVTGGLGPYVWEISGTGFSLANKKTRGVYNQVLTDGTACGSADITVTDECGTVVEASIKCVTAGIYVDADPWCPGEVMGSVPTSYQHVLPWVFGDFWYEAGKWKCRQYYENHGTFVGACADYYGQCAENCEAYESPVGYCKTGAGCTQCLDNSAYPQPGWTYCNYTTHINDATNNVRCLCTGALSNCQVWVCDE